MVGRRLDFREGFGRFLLDVRDHFGRFFVDMRENFVRLSLDYFGRRDYFGFFLEKFWGFRDFDEREY